MFACCRLPQGRLIHAICKPFIRDRESSEGAIICDAVAMAIALDPSVIKVSHVIIPTHKGRLGRSERSNVHLDALLLQSSQERFVDVELGGTYSR